MDTVVIAISLPVAELARIDACCERVQMARSHFLRKGAGHFIAFIEGPTKPGQEVTSARR